MFPSKHLISPVCTRHVPDAKPPINLTSMCGVDRPFFSVQFHPEAAAGPTDASYLFKTFLDIVRGAAQTRCLLSPLIFEKQVVRKVKTDAMQDMLDYFLSTGSACGKWRSLNRTGDTLLTCDLLCFLLVNAFDMMCALCGQAGEFDYSGSQACKALKEEGIEVIVINPNIATVQTSQSLGKSSPDKVYFLPIRSVLLSHCDTGISAIIQK